MKAVIEVQEGILVDIEVSTKSNKFEIAGYNEWRERIEIRIKSPPVKGKANKEIINEFSKLTENPVEIVSGLKSMQKTLKVYNMSKSDFLKILDINNVF
ncbi:MAG: DUF167 family protein [Methanobacterium sp.]|nr:DUF167 family protein [Methanobacterium sp.]